MKRLIFMRHGYLEDNYKDYSNLKFVEFENLLTKKANPKIDKERTNAVLKVKTFLSDVNFIICSGESRGIETAQLVKEITGVNFETSSLLNEVDFTKGIINNKDIVDFNYLRKKILTRFYNSDYSENFDDAKKRFLDFLVYVKELNYNTVLCITHGWFMRLIYIYSVKNSLENVSLKELLEAKVPDFLDTVEVEIDNY